MTACSASGRSLVVIGSGPERARLERLAGPSVRFLGWQPDEVIRDHYRRCRALLFPGEEDFGIVPIEALACGSPVIALGRGGAAETVDDRVRPGPTPSPPPGPWPPPSKPGRPTAAPTTRISPGPGRGPGPARLPPPVARPSRRGRRRPGPGPGGSPRRTSRSDRGDRPGSDPAMSKLASLAAAVLAVSGPGFSPLHDGRSLAGWTAIGGKPGNWRAGDGLLATRGVGKGWISTNRAFGDFILKLEYRIGPGGNSGVLIRAPHRGDPSFDAWRSRSSTTPRRSTGDSGLTSIPARSTGSSRPSGAMPGRRGSGTRWRSGPRGPDPGRPQRRPGRRRRPRRPPRSPRPAPGDRPAAGSLGLQSHESPAEFRGLEIIELRPSGAAGGSRVGADSGPAGR